MESVSVSVMWLASKLIKVSLIMLRNAAFRVCACRQIIGFKKSLQYCDWLESLLCRHSPTPDKKSQIDVCSFF